MSEITGVLVSSIIAIITAVTSLVIARIENSKTKAEIQDLQSKLADSEKLYYVECPKCKYKIYLSKTPIKTEKESV